MDTPDILVTNDDGIDSAGFHILCDALSAVGSVTAVAPADDQSAVGRTLSQSVRVTEHELGYVVDGTPVDCVVAGLSTLVPETDLIVAGCNKGANMGAAVLGRSGTVSAAVEGAFHGVPGIAVSLYVPGSVWESKENFPAEWFDPAVSATRYLVDNAFERGLFEEADYLNVNAPTPERYTGEMAVTVPSDVYELTGRQNGDAVELYNPIWEKLENCDVPDAEGTDRHAVLSGKVSVSPLTAPHSAGSSAGLNDLASRYTEQSRQSIGHDRR